MEKSTQSLLVIPSHDAGLQELLLSVKGMDRQVILLLTYYTHLQIPEHITVIRHGAKRKLADKKSWRQAVAKWLPNFMSSFIEHRIFSKQVAKRCAVLKALCQAHGITKILINNDRSAGFEYSAYLLRDSLDLTLIHLSFAASADINSIAFIRKNERYFYQKTPDWNTHIWDGRLLSFYPSAVKKHIQDNIGATINPFISGMSFCDFTLLQCEREKDRLLALGAQEERYYVTGQAVHDCLFESKNEDAQNILEQYQITSKQKFILLATPIYYELGFVSREAHDALISDLITELRRSNYPIIMTLHPKADPNDYQKFCGENVYVSHHLTYQILPHCEILVSAYSSVTEWALCLKKKILLVDQVGLNYDFFYKEFHLPVAKTTGHIWPSLQAALDEQPSYSEALLTKLPAIDGAALERIHGYINSDV